MPLWATATIINFPSGGVSRQATTRTGQTVAHCFPKRTPPRLPHAPPMPLLLPFYLPRAAPRYCARRGLQPALPLRPRCNFPIAPYLLPFLVARDLPVPMVPAGHAVYLLACLPLTSTRVRGARGIPAIPCLPTTKTPPIAVARALYNARARGLVARLHSFCDLPVPHGSTSSQLKVYTTVFTGCAAWHG